MQHGVRGFKAVAACIPGMLVFYRRAWQLVVGKASSTFLHLLARG